MAPKNVRRTSGANRDTPQRQANEAAQAAKATVVESFLKSLVHEALVESASRVHAAHAKRLAQQGRIEGGCRACGQVCHEHTQIQQNSSSSKLPTPTPALATREVSQPASQNGGSVPPESSASSSQPTASAVAATTTTDSLAPPTLKAADLYSNNPLLACMICGRQVSTSRYSLHLAKCLHGPAGKASAGRRKANNVQQTAATNAAAQKQARKVASALEARRKAGGLGSDKGTPAPSSDDESARDKKQTKPSTLADSLGLNKNGKRASSSPAAKGFKKARTNTPPPTNTGAATIPSVEGPSMVRSTSAQSFVASGLSTAPVLGSPLNPHKYAKDVLVGKPSGTTTAPAGRGKIKIKTKSSLGNVAVGRATARKSATPGAASREASVASSRDEVATEEEEEDDDEDDEDSFSPDPSPTKRGGAPAWEEDEQDADSDSVDGNASASESDAESSASEAPVQRKSHHAIAKSQKAAAAATKGGIIRSRGSDGEFIDVDSASAPSADESF